MLMLANFQISLALQVLRERSGISAEDLNARAGLPPGEVARIEAGETGLDYLTAARLTNALRIGLAEIAITAHALDPATVKLRYEDCCVLARASHKKLHKPHD